MRPKTFLYFSIALLLLAALGYFSFFSAVSFKDEPILIEIKKGQNLAEVTQNLKSADLIRSALTFKITAKLNGVDKKIRPGRYTLSPSMNLKTILNAITNQTPGQISVTIPEGFSIKEIDEKLAGLGLIFHGEFAAAAVGLEGYLFPDTYFVFKTNFSPYSLIDKMKDNFIKKLTPDLLRAIEKQKRRLPETVIIASIIEKEARAEKDYPIVAGILWKRLDAKWPLQADATLLYSKSTSIITAKDLAEETPYNTRKNKGLPPTPIGNPGLATIRAAIFPEDSPYWFYLTDSEGNMHYAKTNEEHNENKRKYL